MSTSSSIFFRAALRAATRKAAASTSFFFTAIALKASKSAAGVVIVQSGVSRLTTPVGFFGARGAGRMSVTSGTGTARATTGIAATGTARVTTGIATTGTAAGRLRTNASQCGSTITDTGSTTGGALSKLSIMSISISSSSKSIFISIFMSSAGPAPPPAPAGRMCCFLAGIAASLALLLLFSASVSGLAVVIVRTIFALRLSYLSVTHFFYTCIMVEIVCVCPMFNGNECFWRQ